jgi:hypothetical protein
MTTSSFSFLQCGGFYIFFNVPAGYYTEFRPEGSTSQRFFTGAVGVMAL